MKIYAGTSGYSYKGWHKRFYPENLPQKKLLEFYAGQFSAVEINSSFYRLPTRKTIEKWQTEVPESFKFCLKISRFITHNKKLKDSAESAPRFLEITDALKKKHRGPLLLQLPPRFKPNLERLDEVLGHFAPWPVAVEVRQPDWYGDELNTLLDRHKAGLVMHDMPVSAIDKPNSKSPFLYIRFHGPKGDYGGDYSKQHLNAVAKRLKDMHRRGRDIYAFFNNDRDGYAPFNAQYLASCF